MAHANKNFVNSKVIGKSCQSFLKEKAPQKFIHNVTEEEKTKIEEFSLDRIEVTIDRPIDKVWETYLNLSLNKILNTRESEVCRIVDENGKKADTLREKIRLFVNMNFESPFPLIPVMKSMTAMEVTKVDHEKKSISMTYLEGTPSRGWQVITLTALDNKTKLVHDAYYKGNNKFIHDMYSPVHKDIWGAIHKNAKKRIEK